MADCNERKLIRCDLARKKISVVLQNYRRLEILFTICIFVAALALLEISFISAIIIIFMVATITNFGKETTKRVGYDNVGLGLGAAVGIGFFVFSGQLLLLAGFSSTFAHKAVIFSMVTVVILAWSKRKNRIDTSEASSPNLGFIALAIALLVLSVRQVWLVPFAGAVACCAILFSGKRLTFRHITIALLLLGTTWTSSLLLRPKFWWHFDSSIDSQILESISWSITRWGVSDNPGFVGGSIAGYHWLTYAFFGAISSLANLEPWSALIKIGPLLLYVFGAQLLLDSIENKKISLSNSWIWIIIIFVIRFSIGSVVDSLTFSILLAFAFLYLTRSRLNQNNVRVILFWMVFSTTLVFAKFSTAFIVGLILGISLIFERRSSNWVRLIPLISLLFMGTLISLLLVSPNRSAMFIGPQIPTLKSIQSLLESLVTPNSFLPHLVVWTIAALLLLLTSHSNSRSGSLLYSLALLTPPSLLASTFFHRVIETGFARPVNTGIVTARYFLFVQAFLLTIFCAIELLNLDPTKYFKNLKTKDITAISVLTIGLAFGIIWRFFNWGLKLGNAIYPETLLIVLLISLFSLSLMLRLRKYLRVQFLKFSLTTFVLIAGVLFGFSVNDYLRNVDNYDEYYSPELNVVSSFGTNDLILIGKFIRENTSEELILASNNFYPDRFQGGSNYLLPAETRRRFLIQGLFHLTGSGEPSKEQINRMNLSIEFAQSPSELTLKRLKEYGVGGYVVNLALTNHRDWAKYSSEVFRSGNFVFLVLR